MLYSSKKNEVNESLLIELLQKEISQTTNEFKNNCLWITEKNITPEELGKLLGRSTTEIIAYFWNKKILINQNQNLTPDLLSDYCQSCQIEIKSQKTLKFGAVIQKYLEKIAKSGPLVKRPPVVSVMGHIDHGKTTLLDTINQTSQQKKEAGGITQKVSIYQNEFKGQRITFLDTPGHSIFVKMRQRGISLTDLVVLVIEASEGVMFQTVEIINYLQEHKLPVIVFINHKNPSRTDRPSNLHKIATQCSERGLDPLAIISGNAKKVQDPGINELLENIVNLSDFRSFLQVPANGVVIDSYFDSQTKHWINEVLIEEGELTEKDSLFLGGKFAKVKTGTIYNIFAQKTASRASPGDLLRIIDLNVSVELGERFLVVNNKEIEEIIQKELEDYWNKKKNFFSTLVNQEKKNINLVLVVSSENIRPVLHDLVKKKNSLEVGLTIVGEIVGNLTPSDLKLVKSTGSSVLLFGKINPAQKRILQVNNVSFFATPVIYEMEKELDKIIDQHQTKEKVTEEIGVAQVKKVFSFSRGNIAGFRVIKGKIKRSSLVQVWRAQQRIFAGEIKSLESEKIKLNEIGIGQEGGIVLKNFNDWQEGDRIIALQVGDQRTNKDGLEQI